MVVVDRLNLIFILFEGESKIDFLDWVILEGMEDVFCNF